MARPRRLERLILELAGEFAVVRRRTLHELLPHHKVTINDTLREMLAAELLAEKGKGHMRHVHLTPTGRERLRWMDEDFEEYDFLPSNARAGMWERLLLVSDVAIALRLAGVATRPWERQAFGGVDGGEGGFYGAGEVKGYFGDQPSLRYSRIAGVLLTPDAPYRVYHTRDVAMELRGKGESALARLLSANVFDGLYGGPGRVLVFGDREMMSAGKILYNTLFPNATANRLRALTGKKKGGHGVTELLSANSLGPGMHFLPLRREVLPLLRMFTLSGGLEAVKAAALSIWFRPEEARKLGERLYLVGESLWLYVVDMRLDAIVSALSRAGGRLRKGPVHVVCMDWQVDFWGEQLGRHFPEVDFWFAQVLEEDLARVAAKVC